MGTLYQAGWRQGTVFEANLHVCTLVASAEGPVHTSERHRRWLVATQNCELSQLEEWHDEPAVELRPVFSADPPSDWGIRSWRLLLQDDPPLYLVSASPRVLISPAALVPLAATDTTGPALGEQRRRALKTWLGLRYDRPAVPEHLVALARAIAGEVGRRQRREVGLRVRDVLMQFDDDHNPPRFSLFAVLAQASDERAVRLWLADIARAVPTSLGIGDELEAVSASNLSLHLIETSYAADLTQLTWGSAELRGAV